MNNLPEVAILLPHEAPMILIDKLIGVTDLTIHCQVHISENGMFFDADSNSVPAWVGIEFMAQSVAAWSGYQASLEGKSSPIGFLLGSRRYNSSVECYENGKTLDIFAEQLMQNEGMAAFACTIEWQGEEIASAQLNAFVPSQDKLDEMLKPQL